MLKPEPKLMSKVNLKSLRKSHLIDCMVLQRSSKTTNRFR